ncbi:MAG: DNA replication/repair protein RecF [Gammaproteobacteria bacterium]|nr:DNA replication/repair protein RecF [Gammaproteobacteria bacterium]
MTRICQLQIDRLRNIKHSKLEFSSTYNLIYGQNGSGKTALLEALYILGHGKSFRGDRVQSLIQHGQVDFVLYGEAQLDDEATYNIGVEKTPYRTKIKINGQRQHNASELASFFPIILVNPDSYDLLEEGPSIRRQFLDWGLFHVEHSFHKHWHTFNRCLKQRNAALKSGDPETICRSWDTLLIESSAQVTESRQHYLQELTPWFEKLLNFLEYPYQVQLKFVQGWSGDLDYGAALNQSFQRDCMLGHTSIGPQRADILLEVYSKEAAEILSRGQEKLLVTILRLAQGLLLKEKTGKHSIYLLDDLASELDHQRREQLYSLLDTFIQAQIFITATEQEFLPNKMTSESKLFHVEQGEITTLADNNNRFLDN